MASKRDNKQVDVSWEDQRNICTFGRVHQRYTEVLKEISNRQKDIEKIGDASDEIIIAEDVKYVFGESFVSMDSDSLGSLLEEKRAFLQQELEAFQKEKIDMDTSMTKLKAVLYAKFGSQIYLENE